jgi:hypothetical protein
MAELASWYGSFLAKFSLRVQEKFLFVAETFQFKAGQDIFGVSDGALAPEWSGRTPLSSRLTCMRSGEGV